MIGYRGSDPPELSEVTHSSRYRIISAFPPTEFREQTFTSHPYCCAIRFGAESALLMTFEERFYMCHNSGTTLPDLRIASSIIRKNPSHRIRSILNVVGDSSRTSVGNASSSILLVCPIFLPFRSGATYADLHLRDRTLTLLGSLRDEQAMRHVRLATNLWFDTNVTLRDSGPSLRTSTLHVGDISPCCCS